MIGGVAVLVAAGIVAGLLVGLGGKKSPSASGSHTRTPASTPSSSAGSSGSSLPASLEFPGSPSTVTATETDPKTGLTWALFGTPWTAVSATVTGQGDFDTGQQIVTDKFKLNGQPQEWSADILSGDPGKDVGFKYTGPGALEGYADAVVNNVILTKEYPPGTKVTVFASQAFTVSGKPGWLIAFTPRFKLAGVKATHDTDVAIAVATDPANPHVRPGLFFVSIPSDVNQFLPDITLELHSLKVKAP